MAPVRDQVQEIKDAVDIVQVIHERIGLKKAGKNYKGLCPFHSEKTPSFFVTPDIQRYKCFGCGKSGDVLTFVQEYDSLTFGETLQQLADRAGIQLERKVFSHDDLHRQRVAEVLSLAREYYHFLLTEHALGKGARTYVQSRGITQESIATFKLGYALQSWDALQKYLIGKKKYTERELQDAGLVIPRNGGGSYDRFRDRLIFPLTDHQGRVVGFSGRVLDPEAKEAKYINSPETMLYHKSELLFGYSVLKTLIRKEQEVLIVEGELDVISSYQAGVKHVVAIKGSALTEQHVRLLARAVPRMVLALDADAAGIEATTRAITIATPFELSVRVLPLHGGKDPDEIARESPRAWREMVKHTISAYEFLIDAAFRGQDEASGEGKRLITRQLVPILSSIANAVEQAFYIESTAKRLGVKQDALETEVKKYIRGHGVGLGVGRVGERNGSQEESKKEEKPDLLFTLQKYVLALVLHAPVGLGRTMLAELSLDQLLDVRIRKIWTIIEQAIAKDAYTVRAVVAQVPEELQPLLSEIFLEHDVLDGGEDEEKLQKEWVKTKLVYLEQAQKYQRGYLGEKLAALEEKESLSQSEQQEYEELLEQLKRVGVAS